MGLVSELRRRNVLRMVVLYIVAAWLIMQVAEVIIGLANLPEWVGTTTLIVLAVGFPIALIFSWFYELTPEGISLEKDVAAAESITHVTGRRLDFIVISLLCAGLILFAYDKWWIGPPPERSIAVLAFENLSDDPGQEYFSDGVSEEILSLLAQLPELKVISRSSAFSFKGRDVPIPEIARQLNVAHVLEGSVRRAGDQVRITAQLIDASDDSHLWSESYSRELNDVFQVQDEIALAISDALRLHLKVVAGQPIPPTANRSSDTLAYDAYLQGLAQFRLRNVRDAIDQYERALRLDETFAPAHANLAIATTMLVFYGELSAEDVARIAIPHLERAQQLEPDMAETHAGRGLLAGLKGDSAQAIDHMRKALVSNPSYSFALNSKYIAELVLGRYSEADVTIRQMMMVDPLSIVGQFNYVSWLCDIGQFDEARAVANRLLEQQPAEGLAAHVRISLLHEGKIADGLAWSLQLGKLRNKVLSSTSWAFREVGEYREARRYQDDIEWIDFHEGNFDEAIMAAQQRLQNDPDDRDAVLLAARSLYMAGRFDEAVPIYSRIDSLFPATRASGYGYMLDLLNMAFALSRIGEEESAQKTASIVRQDLATLRGLGKTHWSLSEAEAVLAAFSGDEGRAIESLEAALRSGLRNVRVLKDPVYDTIRHSREFVALREKFDAVDAEEREKVLQLVCFNNPAPENWQPLPETCKGVVQASGS